jgi:hypothetical protein
MSATYRLDGIGMASGNINESGVRGLCGHYYHHLSESIAIIADQQRIRLLWLTRKRLYT